MSWGGSQSTKPCVFPCKVAAGDDERYLVCAAVAAAVGLSFFSCRSVPGDGFVPDDLVHGSFGDLYLKRHLHPNEREKP